MGSDTNRTVGDSQVVVVTGASAGIGRAVARAYGERGARVGLIARTEEALRAATSEIEAAGGEAMVCLADVADADAVERAAEAVTERWGHIDVWVNNAMATVFAPIREMTADEFRRVTEVTYLGYVYGTQAALRRMLPRGQGTIVQISSSLAYRSIPLQSSYCAAKHAIVGFTDSLRSELIHDGSNVRVTTVHLPAVNTPQAVRQRNKMDWQAQQVPPLFNVKDIAERILWAADHAPREVSIGKQTVLAILGQKLIPGRLDRKLAHDGWDSQLMDVPNRQTDDMLFDPLSSDAGARGPYTEKEQEPDLQMRLVTHPKAVAGGALAAAAAIAVGLTGIMKGRDH